MTDRPNLYISTTLVVTAAILSFTPWYSIGYILLAVSLALFGRLLSAKSSLFNRLLIYTLIIISLIPLVGYLCLSLGTTLKPQIVILSALVIESFSFRSSQAPFRLSKKNILSKADLIAISVALIAPLIMATSYLSRDYASSAFQLASNGWDNGAHILMVYSTTEADGFNYKSIEKGDIQADPGVEGYPQAWHLTTSNTLNGFGETIVSQNQPFRTLYIYIATLFAWSFVTSYVLTASTWSFFVKIKKRKPKLAEGISLLASSLMIQVLIIYGSLNHGFPNYISALCYLLLMLFFGSEWLRKQKSTYFLLSLFFGLSATIQWFLVLPIVALTMAAIIVWMEDEKIKNKTYIYTSCVLAALVSIVPIYIFIKLNPAENGDQLNAGSYVDLFNRVNAVFPVNVIFFGTVSMFTLFYGVVKSKLTRDNKKIILLSLMPALLFSFALFMYQNMTNGGVSYYFMKILGISLVMTSVVACTLFADISHKLSLKIRDFKLLSVSLPLILLATVAIYSGQSFYGFYSLFRDNTRISTPVATKVSNIMVSSDPSKDFIVIFRNMSVYEDYNSKLPNRVTNQPRNCAYWVSRSDNTPEEVVDRVDSCADELNIKGQNLHIITSNKTKPLIEELGKENVIIHNVK